MKPLPKGYRPVETEAEFQTAVIQAARALGWTVYHTHDSRRSSKGFPDLVLVRDRVIFAELKREGGKPTAEQIDWLEALAEAGAEAYVWRPSAWPEIVGVLRSRQVRAA